MMEGSGARSGSVPLAYGSGSGRPKTLDTDPEHCLQLSIVQVVWQHGFGYADLENKLLAGTGCVMRIASIRYRTYPYCLNSLILLVKFSLSGINMY